MVEGYHPFFEGWYGKSSCKMQGAFGKMRVSADGWALSPVPQRIYGRIPLAAGNTLPMSGCRRGRRGTGIKGKQRLPCPVPQRIYGRTPLAAGNTLPMSGCRRGRRGTGIKGKQRLPCPVPQRIYGRTPLAAGNTLPMSGCWRGRRGTGIRRKVGAR